MLSPMDVRALMRDKIKVWVKIGQYSSYEATVLSVVGQECEVYANDTIHTVLCDDLYRSAKECYAACQIEWVRSLEKCVSYYQEMLDVARERLGKTLLDGRQTEDLG